MAYGQDCFCFPYFLGSLSQFELDNKHYLLCMSVNIGQMYTGCFSVEFFSFFHLYLELDIVYYFILFVFLSCRVEVSFVMLKTCYQSHLFG